MKKVKPGIFETNPPLCSILTLSVLGSWSVLICIASPPFERTARESPKFATHNLWPFIRTAVTEVDPPRPKSESCARIASSVFSYALDNDLFGSTQNSLYKIKSKSNICIRKRMFGPFGLCIISKSNSLNRSMKN